MREFDLSRGTNDSSSATPEYDLPNLQPTSEPVNARHGMQLPPFNKDQDFGVDRLNIGEDAEALARLAAMSKVENMAIGLFGSWGAGKSFFMQEMKRRIDRLAESQHSAFLSKVVHVEFNAWHYMDTNLYASLANHIYKEVHKSVTGSDVLRMGWVEDIPSVIALKTERDQLLAKKEKQSQAITDSTDQRLRAEITQLGNSYLENMNEKGAISKVAADVLTALDARERGIKLAASVQSLRTRLRMVIRCTPRSAWFALSVFLVAGAAGFFGLSRSGDWNPNWAWLSPAIGVAAFIRETAKDEKVEKAIKFCREAFGKIEAAAKSKAQIQSEIEHTDQALSRIQNELEQIRSGKIIQYYLAERIRSDAYNKELGFIHMLREDFEKLGELLHRQASKYPNVDRIILYIDDLDRCTPKNVIEVLQAVHLILSADIFMIVVAVDIRWVTKCLNEVYKVALEYDDEQNAASAYDYLEKIFQITYQVGQISEENSQHYLRELFKTQDVQLKPQTEPKTESTNGQQTDVDATAYQPLRLKEEEIEDALKFVKLLGKTPRSMKRFVNLYRLMRVRYEGGWERSHILLLLSLMTGYPRLSGMLMKAIWDPAKAALTVNEVLREQWEDPEAPGGIKPDAPQGIKRVAEFLLSRQEGHYRMSELQRSAARVSRYAFHLSDPGV